MRIARKLRSAAIAALVLVAGCLDDPPQKFRLTATLDGATFDATGVVANIENNVLIIAGAGRGALLNLRVAMPTSPGTVSFATDTLAVSKGEVIAGLTTWSTVYGGTGSVTFTQTVGDEISGTFTFTATKTPGQTGVDTRAVTNGSFLARF